MAPKRGNESPEQPSERVKRVRRVAFVAPKSVLAALDAAQSGDMPLFRHMARFLGEGDLRVLFDELVVLQLDGFAREVCKLLEFRDAHLLARNVAVAMDTPFFAEFLRSTLEAERAIYDKVRARAIERDRAAVVLRGASFVNDVYFVCKEVRGDGQGTHETLLQTALRRGSEDTVKVLLAAGAQGVCDPDVEGRHVLRRMLENGYSAETGKLVLEASDRFRHWYFSDAPDAKQERASDIQEAKKLGAAEWVRLLGKKKQ